MALRRSFLALLTAAAALAQEPSDRPPGPPKPPQDENRPPRPDGPWKRGSKPDGDRPEGARPEGPRPDGHRPHWGGGEMTMEEMRERVLKDLEKLTPEQRMEVWRTAWAVMKMSPEKKKETIGFDEQRRKQVREEVETTIKDNGLEIEEGRKREFFGRYFQGRREIEMQVIKEGNERRAVLMKEFAAKLKAEFGKSLEVKKEDDK